MLKFCEKIDFFREFWLTNLEQGMTQNHYHSTQNLSAVISRLVRNPLVRFSQK